MYGYNNGKGLVKRPIGSIRLEWRQQCRQTWKNNKTTKQTLLFLSLHFCFCFALASYWQIMRIYLRWCFFLSLFLCLFRSLCTVGVVFFWMLEERRPARATCACVCETARLERLFFCGIALRAEVDHRTKQVPSFRPRDTHDVDVRRRKRAKKRLNWAARLFGVLPQGLCFIPKEEKK